MSSLAYKAQLPAPTIDSLPFWEACHKNILLLQHCGECLTCFYYPRRLCPTCGGQQLSWQASVGAGTVFSFSEVVVSFFGPEWESELPYTVVLVDLDEGPRMLSRLVAGDYTELRIGARVQVVFVECEQQKIPFFEVINALPKGDKR